MKYRNLGRLPLRVSEIGLGTAQLSNTDGRCQGVKPMEPALARRILATSIELGVNFFDTGDEYGSAELLLGELSSQTKSAITIATKAGRKPGGSRDFSEAYLRERVDRSLKRLRVDRLDLFQVNKPSKANLEDGRVFALLAELKAAGRIRFAGVVVGDTETGFQCLRAEAVDCVQVLYNLLWQQTEDLIGEAACRGIGVIIRSPLNSGLLSGTYTRGTVFPSVDERSQYFTGKMLEDRLVLLQNIQRDLEIDDRDLLETSLRFVLSNPQVSVSIPGASSVEQAIRYIKCSEKGALNAVEIERIKEIVSRYMHDVSQAFQT